MGDIDLRSVRNFLKRRRDRNGDPTLVAIKAQHIRDYLIPELHKNIIHVHMEEICGSLARLSCGDVCEKEHWEQIAELALIALMEIDKMSEMQKDLHRPDEID